jgi:hypothetical protein
LGSSDGPDCPRADSDGLVRTVQNVAPPKGHNDPDDDNDETADAEGGSGPERTMSEPPSSCAGLG